LTKVRGLDVRTVHSLEQDGGGVKVVVKGEYGSAMIQTTNAKTKLAR